MKVPLGYRIISFQLKAKLNKSSLHRSTTAGVSSVWVEHRTKLRTGLGASGIPLSLKDFIYFNERDATPTRLQQAYLAEGQRCLVNVASEGHGNWT